MVSCSDILVSTLFEYDTQKIVHIQSKTVGLINRFIQLIIIAYIVGFVLVYNKGYQEFDDVLASVSTKVKGYSFANKTIAGDFPGIWDVADYTVPPQENNAIFVTTNAILTYDQEQTKCPEAVSANDFCNNDQDCAPMTTKVGGNGVRTGKCVNSSQSENNVCEIYSWCPLENDTLTGTPLLTSAENFTLFIKNNILFPKFGVSRKNVPPNLTCQYDAINNTLCPVFRLGTLKDVVRDSSTSFGRNGHHREEKYFCLLLALNYRNECLDGENDLLSNILDSDLKRCRFNASDPTLKFCPIFVLNDIVQFTSNHFDDLNKMGASIQIQITWDCNLDFDETACLPKYNFKRLDNNRTTNVSEGYNFRYAHYYKVENVTKRTLIKAYGIQFIIVVQGRAGKFYIIPLMLNIGSGLALLTLSSIVCDIIMLYVHKLRKFYRDKKYQNVEEVCQQTEMKPSGTIDKTELLKNEEKNDVQNYGATM